MTEQIKVIDLIQDETNYESIIKDYNDGDEYIKNGLDELEKFGFVEYEVKDGQLKSYKLLSHCQIYKGILSKKVPFLCECLCQNVIKEFRSIYGKKDRAF